LSHSISPYLLLFCLFLNQLITREIHCNLRVSKNFLENTQKAQDVKENNKLNFIKIKFLASQHKGG
jgi:hypothetical protein